MKVKKGYVLREVADQFVVVPTGEEALNLKGMLTLNKSGKMLWEMLLNETTEENLVQALLSKYQVSEETALTDVREFINILRNKKIIE